MASYFRNFFGGHSSSNLQGNSVSTPSAAAANPNLTYISRRPLLQKQAVGGAIAMSMLEQTYNEPSPLRYPT
jgi:hypothetical protein